MTLAGVNTRIHVCASANEHLAVDLSFVNVRYGGVFTAECVWVVVSVCFYLWQVLIMVSHYAACDWHVDSLTQVFKSGEIGKGRRVVVK